MIAFFRVWQELMTPSPQDESAYAWLVIGAAHALLGAALAGLLDSTGLLAMAGGTAITLRLAVGAIYWATKEAGDLRRGGGIADGIVDALLVAYGLTYDGPWWWPVALIIALGAGALLKEQQTSKSALDRGRPGATTPNRTGQSSHTGPADPSSLKVAPPLARDGLYEVIPYDESRGNPLPVLPSPAVPDRTKCADRHT